MTDPITIEAGKFYRTRDGYKCGPINSSDHEDSDFGGYIPGTGYRMYRADGTHAYGNADLDLVAEWVEEAPADGVALMSAPHPEGPSVAEDADVSLDSIENVEIDIPDELYREIRTDNPPVLALEGGELVIKLINGSTTMIAKVGDGRYFFSQVVEMLLNPALLKAHKASAFAREVISWND